MKELIKELEESIYDCKIDASNGVNNLDCVSDAIELLDKLKEAINYTNCCTELCDCVLPYIKRAEVCGGCGLLIKK